MSVLAQEQRTVLVTGASSGIGAAITEKLLGAGHHVIGIGRDFSKIDFANACFSPIQLDLADLDRLPKALEALQQRFPPIDTLILAAGIGDFGCLEEFSYIRIRKLVELNFLSQAYIARAWIPRMKRRRQGDVIFIGSEAGLKGSRKGTVYCASKFALRGFAQALREECGSCGVRVSLINPGMVKSRFYEALDFEPGENESQHLLPLDVAELVLLLLNLRQGCVVDEINLTPLQKVIHFKKRGKAK